MINLIVAHGKNLEIGHNNQLLWHLPEDMKRFKNITMGHIVVMGRKTFESIGRKPLPGRHNIVVSRTCPLTEGVGLLNLDRQLELFLDWSKGREIFIIGGAEVYKAFLPYADRIYLTLVKADYPEADTFFPEYNTLDWNVLEYTDTETMTFITYER